MEKITNLLNVSPVIAAVKDSGAFQAALRSDVKVIFMLKGDICSIDGVVRAAHEAGKSVFLHLDLLDGFGRDEYALRYIKSKVAPDGIITTKAQLVKIAGQLGIPAIFRAFIFDNMSFQAAAANIRSLKADLVEILPALMPTVIKRLSDSTGIPLIAGGLVSTRAEVEDCIKAGARGVSTSCVDLW